MSAKTTLKNQQGNSVIEILCVVALSIFLSGGSVLIFQWIKDNHESEKLAWNYAQAQYEVAVALRSYLTSHQETSGIVAVQTLYDTGFLSAEHVDPNGTFESGQQFYGSVNREFGFPMSVGVFSSGEINHKDYARQVLNAESEGKFYRQVSTIFNRLALRDNFVGAIYGNNGYFIFNDSDIMDKSRVTEYFPQLRKLTGNLGSIGIITLQKRQGYAIFVTHFTLNNNQSDFYKQVTPIRFEYAGYSMTCPDYGVQSAGKTDFTPDLFHTNINRNDISTKTESLWWIDLNVGHLSTTYAICLPSNREFAQNYNDILVETYFLSDFQGQELRYGEHGRCNIYHGVFWALEILQGKKRTLIGGSLYSGKVRGNHHQARIFAREGDAEIIDDFTLERSAPLKNSPYCEFKGIKIKPNKVIL